MDAFRSSRSGSVTVAALEFVVVPAVIFFAWVYIDYANIADILRVGRYWDLGFFIFMMASCLYYLDRVSKGAPLPRIRAIAAIEAIREGVGRAVEIRKPVHFSFGSSGVSLTGTYTGETLAGLGVLGYTAGLCAELGARFIFHMPAVPAAIPLLQGTVLEAYAKEGKLDEFDEKRDLRYYGGGMMVYTAAMAQSFMQEGVAMKIMMGSQPTCMYVALEAARLQGAIVIGGTSRWTAMYSFILTCDYVFIGEEVFAAGAKVTGNPYMISSLASEELAKYFALALLFIGTLIMLTGFDFIKFLKN
jgi:hypothetical protein